MSDFENGTPSEGGKGLAIASMVLGIASIVLICIQPWIAFISGIVGLVLAIVYNKNNEKCGMSKAGLICSIIGIILFVVIIVLAILGLAALGGAAALSELAM